MRIQRKSSESIHEGDLTPMIDMTFQLIAFFMVLVNFSQAEQHERIKLPDSVLAKPPEEVPDFYVTLHLDDDGRVIYSGFPDPNGLEIDALKPFLDREVGDAKARNVDAAEVTVIIRGDQDANTGDVQRLIQKCQESSLQKFALRVKERLVY